MDTPRDPPYPPFLRGGENNRWRSNLIDLSRRNPLLSLRPTGSAYLAILQPGPDDVFEQLVRGRKPLPFRLPSGSRPIWRRSHTTLASPC